MFIFSGIIAGAVKRSGWDFRFDYQDIETLNAGARAARWDLVKISYANHPGVAETYRLLDCGGALGRGCGPLLLTNTAARDLFRDLAAQGVSGAHRAWRAGAEVLVPGRYTTANFLLDFFHHEVDAEAGARSTRPLKKTFLAFDELYRRLLKPEPCQAVVIHEMRFTYERDGLHLVQDLGEYWEKRTGHPIPLGACALRRTCDAAPEEIESLIRASLDWAYAHEAEALALCRQHSQSMAEEVLRSHIALYVNEFSRDLGTAGKAAVDDFLARLQGKT
jgi:1,4-dihydroxy-6-naphthoate synthase